MNGNSGFSFSILIVWFSMVVLAILHVCEAYKTDEILKNQIDFQNQQRTANTPKDKSNGCPQASFRFPYDNRVGDFIRVVEPIPQLSEFTVCFEFTKSKLRNNMVIHYASDIHATYTNDYALNFRSNELCIYINNGAGCIASSFQDHKKYHICIATFAASPVTSYVFVDSILKHIVYQHDRTGPIAGNGVLLIGTDQHTVGRQADSDWIYHGIVSNVRLWRRILDIKEIELSYRDSCFCPPGYLFAVSLRNVEFFGATSPIFTRQCTGSE